MNQRSNLVLFVALVIVSILLQAAGAFAQTPAGSMTSITGDARIVRGTSTVAATPGMAVDVGDRIITGPNSRATVTLTDNSKLELDASTTLLVDQHMASANSRNTKMTLFSRSIRPTRSRQRAAPNTTPPPRPRRQQR